MEWRFYPASATSFTRSPKGEAVTDPPTPLTWTDPRSHAWPEGLSSVLLSFYYWKDYRPAFREQGNTVFGDSGGFTVLTKGAVIDPREVIRWQLQHCSVGAILDIPPYDGTSSLELRWENLERTLTNVKLARPIYERAREEGTEFRWWGVIQGRTREEQRAWYHAVREIYPFDDEGEGWAIKAVPTGDPRSVARALYFLKDAGIRHAHFLMTTAPTTVATLLALGPRAGLDYLSFDSATADLLGAKHREVLVPDRDRLGYRLLETREGEKNDAAEAFLRTCDCGSCRCLREDYPDRAPRNKRYLPARFTFHNALTLQRIFNALSEAADEDPDALLRRKLGEEYRPVLRSFEYREPFHVPRGRRGRIG